MSMPAHRSERSRTATAPAIEPAPEPGSTPAADANFLATIIASSPEAILVADDTRRFVWANDAACRLLGRPIGERIALRFDDLLTADDRPHADDTWRRVLAAATSPAILRLVRADGTVRQVEAIARPSIVPERHLLHLHDVTDCVLAERELVERLDHETVARYVEVLDALPDAVVVLRAIRDASGTIVDETIEYANPVWRRAFLGSDADPAGRPLLASFPAFADRLPLHRRVIETGEPFRAVLPMPGGVRGWHDVLYLRSGDGIVSLARDVTAEREAKEALATSETKYAELAARLPIGLYVFRTHADKTTSFDYLSPPAARILGVDAERAVRDPLYGFSTVHPDDAVDLAALSARMADHPEPFRWEARFIVDGEIRRIRVESQPERVEGHEIVWHGTIADVTEQRRAEEAYRQTQERFQRAMAESAIGIAIVSPEGRYRQANAAACALFGRTEAELATMTWQELTHPADLAADLAYNARLLSGELDHFRLAKRLVRPDGSVRHADLVVSAIRDADGTLLHFLNQIVDVTDLVLAEERYRLIAENASDVVFREGTDGLIAWVSPAVAAVAGWDPDDLVGRSLCEFVHPDDADVVTCAEADVANGAARRFEARVTTRDGAHRWMDVVLRPMIDEAGEIVGRAGSWRDVTAERAAFEALRESEARFRAAFEENPETISIFRPVFDADGRFEDAVVLFENRIGRERYFGAAPLDQLVGARLFERWPEYRPLLYEQFAAVAELRMPAFREVHGSRADGEYWSETWAFPFDGGFVHVGRDVTASRQATAALRASEERYRSLVDELDAVVCVIDAETRVPWVSPQAEAIFGYSAEQMAVPGFWRSLIVEEDRPRVAEIWDHDEELDAIEQEYRVRRTDGRVVWIHERERSVKGPDGRAIRWYTVAMDVTAQHRLQETERQRASMEQRLGHMTRLARDIVLLADGHGRIVEANDAALATYGWPRSLLIGRTLAGLHAPEAAREAVARLALAARPEGILYESVHRRRDGSTFPVEVSAHVVEIDGEAYQQAIVHDITELRRAREAYERTERLDALGLLAAGVAHDFKNILWGIDLVAAGIKAGHADPDPIAGDARLISDAVAHGNTLVGQLLDFARPRTAGAEVIDVSAAMTSMGPILQRLLGTASRLVVEAGGGGVEVAIDRGSLEQVFINLVVNARDAMPAGGRVTIDGRCLDLDSESAATADVPPGRYVELTVADSGHGMEPAILDRIFDPYFTTKGRKGNGLGLATAFGIVRGAGGAISAESTVGVGTTFRILLPLVEHDPRPTATRRAVGTAKGARGR